MPHTIDPAFEPGGLLAGLADDARMAAAGPAPTPGLGLLAAMGAVATLPIVSPRRKRMPVRTSFGGVAARVAAGVGLTLGGFTVAAAAGVLPAAAQHAVASVVAATTPFQLPNGATNGSMSASPVDSNGESSVSSTTTASTSTLPATSLPPTTLPTTSTSSLPTSTTAPRPPTTLSGGSGQPSNHGACVSAVAHNHSVTGQAHGQAVSAAAQSDCGKGSSSTSTTLAPTTTAPAGVATAHGNSNHP